MGTAVAVCIYIVCQWSSVVIITIQLRLQQYNVRKWTACPAVVLRVFPTDCYMLMNLLNGPSGPGSL